MTAKDREDAEGNKKFSLGGVSGERRKKKKKCIYMKQCSLSK